MTITQILSYRFLSENSESSLLESEMRVIFVSAPSHVSGRNMAISIENGKILKTMILVIAHCMQNGTELGSREYLARCAQKLTNYLKFMQQKHVQFPEHQMHDINDHIYKTGSRACYTFKLDTECNDVILT